MEMPGSGLPTQIQVPGQGAIGPSCVSRDAKGQGWYSDSETVEDYYQQMLESGLGESAGGASAITAGPGRQTAEALEAGSLGDGC